VEEYEIGLSGSGRAIGECWGLVGQANFGCNFGIKPKYNKERAQKEESAVEEHVR
jgi:hypothetical protein